MCLKFSAWILLIYCKPLSIHFQSFFQIFQYKYPSSHVLHKKFEGRLQWHGTMGTKDLQIGTILIHNVTFNDTGTYRCTFHRTLHLPLVEEHVTVIKDVELTVVEEGKTTIITNDKSENSIS